MRTLFLVRFPPYPPTGGAPLRNWQNMNILMKFGPIAVFSITKSLEENKYEAPGIDTWEHHRLHEYEKKITILLRLKRWISPRSYSLTDSLYSPLASQNLTNLMTEFQPDLVIFEEPWLYRYLPIVKEFNCHIIIDAHNIESDLFLAKQNKTVGPLSKIMQKIRMQKIRSIEKDFVQQASQVWVCSRSDALLLQKLYKKSPDVKIIPNGIEIGHYRDIRGQRKPSLLLNIQSNQPILTFVGRFSYSPNEVAALLLIKEIFPAIKKKYSSSSLIIVGSSPTQRMIEAAGSDEDIIVTGFVEDVRPYLALSTMVLVPLQEGGGTRLKILEAFASKIPVISTAKGAEGLNAKDGIHLLIRNSKSEIVNGVDEILSDSTLSRTLTENAHQLVKDQYSWSANSQVIAKNLKKLVAVAH